jgi:nucleotide-binding universal stress UspA family protein
MRVMVGIDRSEQYLEALRLLARLRLPGLKAWLVHARPERDAHDDDLIAHAQLFARRNDILADTVSEAGDPAELLVRVATAERGDLIAIGSGEKGPLGVLLGGSVGRALMTSWRGSLLVAKSRAKPIGNVRCVLGYDGTDTCDAGLTRFLAWNPGGVESVRVVAVETDELSTMGETPGGVIVAARTKEIAARGAERLRKAGFVATPETATGAVLPQLREVAVATSADLIVIPAKPHGTLDRLLFGSTSHAGVAGHQRSVLVVR